MRRIIAGLSWASFIAMLWLVVLGYVEVWVAFLVALVFFVTAMMTTEWPDKDQPEESAYVDRLTDEQRDVIEGYFRRKRKVLGGEDDDR